MKKGKKYAFIGLIVLVLVVLAVVVFSTNHLQLADAGEIELRGSSGSGGSSGTISSKINPLGQIYDTGPVLNGVFARYDERPGVYHDAGDSPQAIYADYLKVSGTGGDTRLFGVSEMQKATYVVPLISGGSCSDLCKYTLGGRCKGVVETSVSRNTNSLRWVSLNFDSRDSKAKNELILSGRGVSLCGLDSADLRGMNMCFCGS